MRELPTPQVRPYLLIDVDGVLIPFGSAAKPVGFVRDEELGHDAWFSPDHGQWLNGMAEWFDLVWATTWEYDAPRFLATKLGLPIDLPVIEFDHESATETWKLQDVERFVGDRPFAWLDDDLWPDAFAWAERRETPTLLIRTLPSVGLTHQDVRSLEAFGRAVARNED